MVIKIGNKIYAKSETGTADDNLRGIHTPAHVELVFSDSVVTLDYPATKLLTCDVSLVELVPLIDALTKLSDDLGVTR